MITLKISPLDSPWSKTHVDKKSAFYQLQKGVFWDFVNSKWPPRSKIKVTHSLDCVKNVSIRFAIVEHLYIIKISFLSDI